MSEPKQIPALPPLDEAPADDDRFVLRDTSSGSDKSLRVDRLLERSGEQVDAHAEEQGGIHGIPEGERALHSQELRAAVSEAVDIDEAVIFVGKGAIVESDTNANGSYVRWENGAQVCFHSLVDSASTHTWTFPAAFISMVSPSALVNRGTSPGRFVTTSAAGTATWEFAVWDGEDGTAASGSLRVSAMGFWK